MWIGNHKEIRKLRWPIHVINPVDKTKLSCITPHFIDYTTTATLSFVSIHNKTDGPHHWHLEKQKAAIINFPF